LAGFGTVETEGGAVYATDETVVGLFGGVFVYAVGVGLGFGGGVVDVATEVDCCGAGGGMGGGAGDGTLGARWDASVRGTRLEGL
jgi:hypothetical protein